jgi:hypothetical protein
MLLCHKRKLSNYTSAVTFYLHDYHRQGVEGRGELIIREDSNQVDGIGGIVWDGALILAYYLSQTLTGPLFNGLVELGCGTGLCGLVASLYLTKIPKILLTDRAIDLVQDNLTTVTKDYSSSSCCECKILDWSDSYDPSRGKFDLIIGAEVAILRAQQEHLKNTILALAHKSSIIMLTFDGPPPKPSADGKQYSSKAEEEFDKKMTMEGYRKAVVFTGRVETIENQSFLSNATAIYSNDLDSIACPRLDHLQTSNLPGSDLQYQHICLYFRPTAINTCSRCYKSFFPKWTSCVCCYHPSYYVCRRHPGETNCSIDGLGDGEGYYGNGKEGWAAEFWDCCGNEDRNAIGCKVSAHISF